jgi:hypothetical protein
MPRAFVVSGGGSGGVEANLAEGHGDFGFAGEGVPDEAGAQVFAHEEANTKVDADDVGVVVVGGQVEGVAKAVAAIGLRIGVLEGAKDAEAVGGKEGKWAGSSVGDNGAVDDAEAAGEGDGVEGRIGDRMIGRESVRRGAGATLGGVAVGGVGGGDAPVDGE